MRVLIKQFAFTLVALLVSPLTLAWLLFRPFGRDATLASFSQFMSLIPGKLGVYCRAGFFRFSLTYCSPDAVVSFLTLLCQQDIEIEEGVYIGPQCNLGKCRIGRNTLLGSGVHIMSGKGQHKFDDLDTPIKDQGGVFEKVTIGENCWLGNGALVMANIGSNSIVGAGSVVTSDIPKNAIVAGNPAKVIKIREP